MFNIVWEHAKNGVQSVMGFDCSYRGDNGRKCFIGACIPDSMYKPEMDLYDNDTDYCNLINNFPEMKILFKDVTPSFAMELQDIHDRSTWDKTSNPKVVANFWAARLRDLASSYNLTVPTDN